MPRIRAARLALIATAFLGAAGLALAEPTSGKTPLRISIKNFGKINDQFFRGAQPKGRDFADLAALGVRTVIDLTPGDSRQEPALVQNAGMKFFRIAMVTTSRPKPEAVAQFLEIVNDPANQPIYVHCAGGRHRTGVMTAAYRITHDGWNFEQAFAEMRKFDFEGGWINHNALKSFVSDFYNERRTSNVVSGFSRTDTSVVTQGD